MCLGFAGFVTYLLFYFSAVWVSVAYLFGTSYIFLKMIKGVKDLGLLFVAIWICFCYLIGVTCVSLFFYYNFLEEVLEENARCIVKSIQNQYVCTM